MIAQVRETDYISNVELGAEPNQRNRRLKRHDQPHEKTDECDDRQSIYPNRLSDEKRILPAHASGMKSRLYESRCQFAHKTDERTSIFPKFNHRLADLFHKIVPPCRLAF